MKLSDYKGEQALDVLVNLLDPVVEMFSDKEFLRILDKRPKVEAIKYLINNHKRAVIEMMAAIDCEDPDTYEIGVFTLPVKLMEMFSDPELARLFSLQGQNKEETSSGPAMENIEVREQ